jgi:asparagine synthase (glutamine-hydrolysing)
MYAIPREQIVRIGQRRSLMKRALVDVVPTDLLNRRRKAFTPPNLLRKTYSTFSDLTGICHDMVSASIGMIDSDRLCEHVRKTQFDENVCDEGLKRTVRLESWLRHLAMIGVLAQSTATEKTNNSPAIGSCEPSLRCPQDFS